MKTFLDRTHPDAFVDHPKANRSEAEKVGMTVECPKCKGHGGWNLELNAYPLHQHADTPENRHKFSHFRAGCNHCQGWGYVSPENADHVHEWIWVRNLGNCLNLYECEVCAKQWPVDSSD